MRILELTNFSAGGCGVWSRVREEALLIAKRGHEVRVFSSNGVKGENSLAPSNEKLGNVEITRFPYKKLGGESFMYWDFEKEALKFKPDLIMAHSYRHLHTTKALKITKKLNCKIFLVTHAPFQRSDSRSILQSMVVIFYDLFIGQRVLNKFTKVLPITKWEIPHLLSLGLREEKIMYLPNGIRKEFFSKTKIKEKRRRNKFKYYLSLSKL